MCLNFFYRKSNNNLNLLSLVIDESSSSILDLSRVLWNCVFNLPTANASFLLKTSGLVIRLTFHEVWINWAILNSISADIPHSILTYDTLKEKLWDLADDILHTHVRANHLLICSLAISIEDIYKY